MKNTFGLTALGLFAVVILGFTPPSLANKKCEALFESEKETANQAGETLEQIFERLQSTKSFELDISQNRVIAIDYITAAAGQPTFLLLPGVNRSLSINEPDVKMISQMGNGVISFDFSTQPLSVRKLKKGIKPYFLDPQTKVTLQSLAEEVEMVAQHFRNLGVKDIIPVSLSFTGAVTPFLKGYPLIVETSPMTSTNAAEPVLAANIAKLKSLEIFNPFFGPAINRRLIDQAYRKQWAEQVERISQGYDIPVERRNEMVEGYLAMSHAVEDFDWNQVTVPKKTERAFIVGANESPALFRSQAETFLRLSRQNKNVTFFLISGAGHIVSVDQPVAYSLIVGKLLSLREYNKKMGGAFYNAITKSFQFFPRKEMEDLVEGLLASYKPEQEH